MRQFLGGNMPSSTSQAAPEELANDDSRHWRPNVSQEVSAAWGHFAPLTIAEKNTYRNMTAFLIAVGPIDRG
jgi:hypothetical protein